MSPIYDSINSKIQNALPDGAKEMAQQISSEIYRSYLVFNLTRKNHEAAMTRVVEALPRIVDKNFAPDMNSFASLVVAKVANVYEGDLKGSNRTGYTKYRKPTGRDAIVLYNTSNGTEGRSHAQPASSDFESLNRKYEGYTR